MTTTDHHAAMNIPSPVGPLHLRASDGALTHLLFGAGEPADGQAADRVVLAEAEAQLAQYFAGQRKTFDLPLAPRGTDFQRTVWAELVRIPHGDTRSYGELARDLGRPGAARAVGAANGQNPISIVQPCHRVIGADGSLTGFGGGLAIKRHLLQLECGEAASRRFRGNETRQDAAST